MLVVRSLVSGLYLQCQRPSFFRDLRTSPAGYTPQQYQRFNYSTNMDAQTQQNELISYWFDRNPKDWFFPPDGLDDEIRTKYGDLITQARAGTLDSWAKEPKGVLSLILLLDQFPRNIFRGSGESFSSDNKALEVVTRAVAQQFDKEIGKTSKIQQSFFYLPFMHAENLLAQVAGVALYEATVHSCEEGSAEKKQFADGISFARKHLDCVAQLGRFPKRNEAIGRPSTEEEIQFLKDHPTGF